jgi:hypothetical protein
MIHSTFEYNPWVKRHLAVSVLILPNGTSIPHPISDEGWTAPDGGLFSSPNEMSKLLSLMFRQNGTQSGSQILDGATVAEDMIPIILMNDGLNGFGLSWEYYYHKKFWIKSKAGSLDGYRSQVAMVPPIKLGVFTAATTDIDDETQSAWSIPALEILLPAFVETLTKLQPPPVLPSNWRVFTGTYVHHFALEGDSILEVYAKNNQLYINDTTGIFISSPYPITQFNSRIFRIVDNSDISCRWLADGMDQELIYFTLSRDGTYCTTVTIMSVVFVFKSKNCHDCHRN